MCIYSSYYSFRWTQSQAAGPWFTLLVSCVKVWCCLKLSHHHRVFHFAQPVCFVFHSRETIVWPMLSCQIFQCSWISVSPMCPWSHVSTTRLLVDFGVDLLATQDNWFCWHMPQLCKFGTDRFTASWSMLISQCVHGLMYPQPDGVSPMFVG